MERKDKDKLINTLIEHLFINEGISADRDSLVSIIDSFIPTDNCEVLTVDFAQAENKVLEAFYPSNYERFEEQR